VQRLADELVDDVGTVELRGVDVIDAELDRAAQDGDRRCAVRRRSENTRARQLHGAESDAVDRVRPEASGLGDGRRRHGGERVWSDVARPRRPYASRIRFTPASGPPSCCKRAAGDQAAEVDDHEARVLEQRGHLGLRVGVVAREEDHAPAAALARVGAEHRSAEGVRGLHDARARDEAGENLARGQAVEVGGVEIVGRVDDDPAVPAEPVDRLSDDASDAGPRLLAITIRRPARSAVRAIAWPSRPAPMIPTSISLPLIPRAGVR